MHRVKLICREAAMKQLLTRLRAKDHRPSLALGTQVSSYRFLVRGPLIPREVACVLVMRHWGIDSLESVLAESKSRVSDSNCIEISQIRI
jgi:hypothetical protein